MTDTPHRISTYRKGKLYRIRHYFHPSFCLYAAKKDMRLPDGTLHRPTIFGFRNTKEATFIYLDYIPNPGPGGDWDYFLVIHRDMVGTVDARMELEELQDPEIPSVEDEGDNE